MFAKAQFLFILNYRINYCRLLSRLLFHLLGLSRFFYLLLLRLSATNLFGYQGTDTNVYAAIRLDTCNQGATFASGRNATTQVANFLLTLFGHLSLRFAQANCRDFLGRNAMANQVFANSVSTTLRQSLIVFVATHEVGMAFNTYRLYVALRQALSQVIQSSTCFRTQIVFVKAKQEVG